MTSPIKKYYFRNDELNTFYYQEGRFIVESKQVSDGYHTMEELYEHRYALFAALIKIYDGYITPLGATVIRCWKSKLHFDGTMFPDSFIAGMSRVNIDGSSFHITYHLPLRWWNRINCIVEDYAPEYDGHTSKDVIERLMKL